MKIAIVNAMAPYIYGGAEFMADSLRDKFVEYGHEAQVIRFHYSSYPIENIADGMLAARLTKIENTDRVIAFKFPAYLIPHPEKRLWLIHQFRQAYELENTEFDMFNAAANGPMIKQLIRDADNRYLKELEGNIYTNSKVVSDRLMRYNGISSSVLFPPLMNEKQYQSGEYGNYIFYPSRVNRSKRQYLAVEAMRHTKSNVKLVIAGKGDCKGDEKFIKELIEKYELREKVTFVNRFISEQEKVDLFKDCLACLYIPYEEDSYGYVSLEAFQSKKAVISCTDSGGTDIVVATDKTGYLVQPTPEALAEAMDKLYENKKRAREMGHNGLPRLHELGISWENVVERFTK